MRAEYISPENQEAIVISQSCTPSNHLRSLSENHSWDAWLAWLTP